MNTLSTIIEPLGWALLHFLWQGTAIALLLRGFLWLARRRSPQVRYAAVVVALPFTLLHAAPLKAPTPTVESEQQQIAEEIAGSEAFRARAIGPVIEDVLEGGSKSKHGQTTALIRLWRAEYKDSPTVPAAAMQRLAAQVKEYIRKYPGEPAEKMKVMLPELEKDQAWSWDKAQAIIDSLCDAATAPAGSLGLTEEFRSFDRVKPGQKWPEEQLAKLPFGEADESGLRAAWIFEPMRDSYATGTVLKCRILFHNNGKKAVEFRTDQWHQDDKWIVKNAAGEELKVKVTWFTGVTPWQRFRLEPGQVCEVAAHGAGIGEGKYEESYSTAAIGAEIPAKSGEELTCQWTVSLTPSWRKADKPGTASGELPISLTTGTVKFKVTAPDPNAAPKVGTARSTGKYDLAEGIKLQVSQLTSSKDGHGTSRSNTATIEWYAADGKLGLSWPIELLPGEKIAPIIWKRGGTALWIAHEKAIRKLDFTNAADVKESVFEPNDAGHFGGAPPEVLLEIQRTVKATTAKLETELDISVPATDGNAPGDRKARELVINVKSDGTVAWNGKTLTLKQLSADLTEVAKFDKKHAIIIRGDVSAPYGKIVEVLDATHEAGLFHVSFATTPPVEPVVVGKAWALIKKGRAEWVAATAATKANEKREHCDAGTKHFTGGILELLKHDVTDQKSMPVRKLLAQAYADFGRLLVTADEPTDASVAFNEAVKIYVELLKEEPANADHTVGLARTYDDAAALIRAGKPGDDSGRKALNFQQHSVTLLRSLFEQDSKNVNVARQLAASLKLNGELHRALGDNAAADAADKEEISLMDSLRDAEKLRGTQDAPDAKDGEKKPQSLPRIMQHEDGTRTESVHENDTLRESTYDKNDVLLFVKVFTPDSKGKLRQGVIYDGKMNPLGSILFGYDRKTGLPSEEQQYNNKAQLIRRLFYPGVLKEPQYAGKFVAFSYDPENPKATPVIEPDGAKPALPISGTKESVKTGAQRAAPPDGIVEIQRPGDYRAGERIYAAVTATVDGNLVRNELTVWATDDSGKEVSDRCALPFGEGTWALRIAEAEAKDGSCRISLASRRGVICFWFTSEKLRARFSKPGFDDEPFWRVTAGDLNAGKIPQFPDDTVIKWAAKVIPSLKDEAAEAAKPILEMRLVSEGQEIPELIRATYSGQTGWRIGRLVSMGRKLVDGTDIVYKGSATGGVLHHLLGVSPAAAASFEEACRKHDGRTAAIVWNGEVTDRLKLHPGLDTFHSLFLGPGRLSETRKGISGAAEQPAGKKNTGLLLLEAVSVGPTSFERTNDEIRETTFNQAGELLSERVVYLDSQDRQRLGVTYDRKKQPTGSIIFGLDPKSGEINEERHFNRDGKLVRRVPAAELQKRAELGITYEFEAFSYSPDDSAGKPAAGASAPGVDATEVQRLSALAQGFYDLGQFEKARETYEAALILDPANAAVRGKWFLSEAMLVRQANPFAVPAHPDVLAEARKTSISLSVKDAEGRKVIPEFRVIAGVRAGSAGGKDVVNWQPHTLRVGTNGGMMWPLDKAYDEMALRVEAEGCAPQVFSWVDKKKGPQDLYFQMVEDKGVLGEVLTPDGQPASGAKVAIAMVQRDAVIEGGKLRHEGEDMPEKAADRWRWPRFIQVYAGGGYWLPAENDPTAAVLIVHHTGVLEMSLSELRKSPKVKLNPWGRIEGRVQWGDKPGGGQKVSLTIHRDTYGYPGIIAQYEKTTAAVDGSFVFEKVLPGLGQLSCPIAAEPGNKSGITEINMTGQIAHVEVKPGTNPAVIGGGGRTVKGKLTGRDSWDGVTFHFHPTAPHVGFPGDDEMWKAWGELKKGPSGPVLFREGLKVNADGTFEISGVLPGEYQIFFFSPPPKEPAPGIPFELPADKKVPQAHVLRDFASGTFSVPAEVPGQKMEPLNAGEFAAR